MINLNTFVCMEIIAFRNIVKVILIAAFHIAGQCSAVGNVSGYRCVSDYISRGREFDPCLVPYFRGD